MGDCARNVCSCHPKGAEVPGSFAARFPASSGGHHPAKSVIVLVRSGSGVPLVGFGIGSLDVFLLHACVGWLLCAFWFTSVDLTSAVKGVS